MNTNVKLIMLYKLYECDNFVLYLDKFSCALLLPLVLKNFIDSYIKFQNMVLLQLIHHDQGCLNLIR